MLDRVREALFSTLVPWLPDAHVLDLFAGSGSLGLEALSRGVERARLVERDPRAVELLERNVAKLGLSERVEVVRGDALAPSSWGGAATADIVFLDPPYAFLDDPATRRRVLEAIVALVRDTLRPAGILVFHAPRGALAAGDLPGEPSCRRYGTNELWYVEREEDA